MKITKKVAAALTLSTAIAATFAPTVMAATYNMPNPQSSPAALKSAGGQAVSFDVNGSKLSANLYLPANYSEEQLSKAIVMVAPQGGLKEQTAGIYAKELAEQGFVTIAFDHRTYGQSGGEPRQTENPNWKAEDIKAAISYISTLKGVNADEVGVLALCSGAGYGVLAAINDARIKAFATVSGVFDFREREVGLDGINKPSAEQKQNFQEKMLVSAQARQQFFETGIMEYTPLVPDLTAETSDFWKQGYDYYRTERGFIDGWENKRSAISMEARYSVNTSFLLSQLDDLDTPFIAIAGTKAFTYPFSQDAVNRAEGQKALYSIEGATHFDLYDNAKYVNDAVGKLTEFYNLS
ncbi:alpha/beta hydrolase, partial [Vibrio sp. FNV 38]|nr:alpha/beta hydrolase [Vibrio sp. FNV 38]